MTSKRFFKASKTQPQPSAPCAKGSFLQDPRASSPYSPNFRQKSATRYGSMPSKDFRVVEFYAKHTILCPCEHGDYSQEDENCYCGEEECVCVDIDVFSSSEDEECTCGDQEWIYSLRILQPPHPLFHVCQESREVTLKKRSLTTRCL